VGAHALRGELRIRLYGGDPDNLALQDVVWLGRDRDDAMARAFAVLGTGSGRPGEIRLALTGVTDRESALALRGMQVLISAESLPALDEDEFYWHELIGCRVETQSGDLVGEVAELWDSGRHDVLVVRDERGRQILVPTAREIMTGVDREARRIVIDAPPGLIDADD
jgi:16S rRNA processing protein RimM